NLSNLEKISNLNFDFVILPLKLKNATGSPVRAIANY
ncbi:MAG: cyclase family protein, partial [Candidatus Nitrosomaritimum aestuariumsis]